MGKRTKPFIDKKTASVYHVVRRSQRDVGTEAPTTSNSPRDDGSKDQPLSDFVLMPSPDNPVRVPVPVRDQMTATKANASAAGNAAGRQSGRRTGSKATAVVDFTSLASTIAAAGLLDETAKTYARHTKPMEQSGTYVPSSSMNDVHQSANLDALLRDASRNALDEALEEAMAVREVGRMLDSIALTPDCMEEDVAAALFGDFEDGEFEELDDDFCLTANQEVIVEDDADGGGEGGVEGFDFERHVRMLMDKARDQENGGNAPLPNDDFFVGLTPLHGRIPEEEEDAEDDFDYDLYDGEEVDDDDDDNYEDDDSLDREFNGTSATFTNNNNCEQQRMLCQKFEEALLEYDSDDMGDLDDECDDIVGDRPIEGDAGLEAALDEYLTVRDNDILIEGAGRKKKVGGSGYSALVGRTMVNASDLDGCLINTTSMSLLVNVEESKRQMAQDMAEADAILANPEMDLPPEEVFIDGKSYFSITSRNPWDCESILSTYSNLDNNPVIIGRSDRRRKKKKGRGSSSVMSNDVIPEERPVRIRLSNKTGLPLRSGRTDVGGGVYDNDGDDEDANVTDDDYFADGNSTYLSINRGEARHKHETLAEKKERKMIIKEERKICRMQKKMMKEAFAEEFQKRGQDVVVDPVGGNSVFRFS